MTKWSYRGISEFRQITIKTTIDLIVDVAQLPFATRVAEKNREKIDHQDLKVWRCDWKIWNCRSVSVIPFEIGALGTGMWVNTSMEISKLGTPRIRIALLQKARLLGGTAKIVRRTLDTEGYRIYLLDSLRSCPLPSSLYVRPWKKKQQQKRLIAGYLLDALGKQGHL